MLLAHTAHKDKERIKYTIGNELPNGNFTRESKGIPSDQLYNIIKHWNNIAKDRYYNMLPYTA